MLPVVLTSFVAAAVVALVAAEARDLRRRVLQVKTVASIGFVLVALAVGAPQHGAFGACIFAGLGLAAGGDVALALPTDRAFLTGLVLFLLGHVAYVAACGTVRAPSTWITAAALVPVAATAMAYFVLAPHLGSLRGAVIAYMVTITVMVAAAIGVRRAGHPHGDRLLVGALLFYVSDLSVARDRFVERAFVNRAWGLPAYYAGQLFMAWAAAT